MELGVSHVQNLSSLPPVVDNIFDKYNNKNLVPIRSLSDHDSDIVSNRLQTLEAKFSSLLGLVAPDASPRTKITLLSTSDWPTPPPRRESIPMLDIHITPEDIQETVKDLEKRSAKFQRYQRYLQKQASQEQG